jgi:hypothetical protein
MVSALSIMNKINDTLKRAKEISEHNEFPGLQDFIKELEISKQTLRKPKLVADKLNFIDNLVNSSIGDFNKCLKEFFLTKNEPTEDLEDAMELLDDELEECGIDDLSKEHKLKLAEQILDAENRMYAERERLKTSGRGQKVRRVPPAPEGIDEIAGMVGLDELAKGLGVKRAKPIVSQVEKDRLITKRVRNGTEDDWAKINKGAYFKGYEGSATQAKKLAEQKKLIAEIYSKQKKEDKKSTASFSVLENQIAAIKADKSNRRIVEEAVKDMVQLIDDGELSYNDLDEIKELGVHPEAIDIVRGYARQKDCTDFAKKVTKEHCESANEDFVQKPSVVNPLKIVEKLESLVGKYTSEALAVERKLDLTKRVLAEARYNLQTMNLSDLLDEI